MEEKAEDSAHSPQEIGNAFVEQYYNLLCHAPENVHKFYQNSSVISRPGSNGSMSSVSTLDGIDKMILSLDYKNCLVEILTSDSQASIGNGVIVLVSGYITGTECRKRKFSQIFLLAPQEANGYFVMNDIFRYVDSDELDTQDRDTVNTIAVVPAVSEDTRVKEGPANAEVVNSQNPLHNVDANSSDDTTSQEDNQSIDAKPVVDSSTANHQDVPKMSYASVASALKLKKQPFHHRNSSSKPVEKPETPAPPAVAPPPPPRISNDEKNTSQIGYSVFVGNLPMNATTEQLREIFEQFGPIKTDGIRVRRYKVERNCFGFVEFESAESMQSAVKATSIMVGDRNAHIEEKKASSDGTKYPSRKGGGFRSDNNRGNYGGRGYGRREGDNQERKAGHYPSNGHSMRGEGFSKTHQNGDGRESRQATV